MVLYRIFVDLSRLSARMRFALASAGEVYSRANFAHTQSGCDPAQGQSAL